MLLQNRKETSFSNDPFFIYSHQTMPQQNIYINKWDILGIIIEMRTWNQLWKHELHQPLHTETCTHATQMPSNSTFPFMWHLRATRCRSCDCVSAGGGIFLTYHEALCLETNCKEQLVLLSHSGGTLFFSLFPVFLAPPPASPLYDDEFPVCSSNVKLHQI